VTYLLERRLGRILVPIALVCVFSATAVLGDEATGETVYARVSVPTELRKIGEVRLLTRSDATVVQTVISTRLISRVVAEIRDKESANWPAGTPGHEDATRYIEAVEGTATTLGEDLAPLDPRDPAAPERRVKLLIEFQAGASIATVTIGGFEATSANPYVPTRIRVMATPLVSRAYVLRNMRLILGDAFDVPEQRVDELGPLGPAAN
jgi:hypothetical protein